MDFSTNLWGPNKKAQAFSIAVESETVIYVKSTKILDFNFDHPNGLLECPNGLETWF